MNPIQDSRFERDTRVAPLRDGNFAATIDRGWWVIRGPNGGYIAAIIQRAISAAEKDTKRHPRSLTIHYISPPTEGEALIETRLERRGRSLSTITARMSQNGSLRALALAAVSSPRESHEFYHASMPDLPGPEELAPTSTEMPVNQRYEYRFIPERSPASGAKEAVLAAWIRLREKRPLDYPLLAAYSDALPPAVFARANEANEFGALPTVDLTVHYRVDPATAEVGPEDFCLAIFRSRVAHRGYIEEDGEIWSRQGRLLAQSRQLAVILGAESRSEPPPS
jgi:acyl-CoA thioesterase